METIKQNIDGLRSRLEDMSMHPQHTIAYPPKYLYYMMIMAKDNYLYTLNNSNSKEKSYYTDYFISCVEMKETNTTECGHAPDSDSVWMKSVKPLPKFKGDMLTSVSPADTANSKHYSYLSWNEIYDAKRSRFSLLDNKYSIRNIVGNDFLYIHVFKKVKPKIVSVMAPFNDIVEVVKYMQESKSCLKCPNECDFMNTPMDIPGEHKMAIYDMAISYIRKSEPQKPTDSKIDERDGSQITNYGT